MHSHQHIRKTELSEVERDPTNGQFVPSSSGVHGWTPPEDVGEVGFGLESVERSSGYTPNINAHVTADDVTDDFSDERIAVERL
jgi:hypothetical protein